MPFVSINMANMDLKKTPKRKDEEEEKEKKNGTNTSTSQKHGPA